MILISKRSRKQTADNNQETTINFSNRILKFKQQKTTTIRFLITAFKINNNTYCVLLVYMLDNMIHTNWKIKLIIEDISSRIFKGKKSFELIARPEESCSD